MSKTKYNKNNFLNLIDSIVENASKSKENAISYLTEQGIDPNEIKLEGTRRLNKIKLQIEAEKTKSKIKSTELIKEKAIEAAKKLLENPNFSFATFLTTHKIAIQYKNIDSFSDKDIENALINYFYLKYLEENKNSVSKK